MSKKIKTSQDNEVRDKSVNTKDMNPVKDMIDYELEVEGIARVVEELGYRKELGSKLEKEFSSLRYSIAMRNRSISFIQEALREMKMDMELVKRALVSVGQSGVVSRGKIERELILDLFPPELPNPAYNIHSVRQSGPSEKVDCAERMHLCKAACCRIFNVYLTPGEIRSGKYNWNPRVPYALTKNRYGCSQVQSGSCRCNIYGERPITCSSYSCAKDARIWKDFGKKELNPELAKRLESLHVSTSLEDIESSPRSISQAKGEQVAPGSVEKTEDRSMPAMSKDSSASSPDFSELRDAMLERPGNVFVPPPSKDKNTDSTAADHNEA